MSRRHEGLGHPQIPLLHLCPFGCRKKQEKHWEFLDRVVKATLDKK